MNIPEKFSLNKPTADNINRIIDRLGRWSVGGGTVLIGMLKLDVILDAFGLL